MAAGETPELEASAPRGVMLSIYDTGRTLVSDLRAVTLARGENLVRFGGVPARMDPSSLSLAAVGGSAELQELERAFRGVPGDLAELLAQYEGQPVEILVGGEAARGRLRPGAAGQESVLLQAEDGSLRLYPNPDLLQQVRVLKAAPGPELSCRLSSSGEGPVNLRMSYTTAGLSWTPAYELLLDEGGAEAVLMLRAALVNQSGGDFDNARVHLVTTTRGLGGEFPVPSARLPGDEISVPFRHAYGAERPGAESGMAAAQLSALEVSRPLALPSGSTRYVQLARAEKLPVRRFYVYDGARFDRFQRNRRTDWNFGTEFHRDVEQRIGFENTEAAGLGFLLPPGPVRLYTRRADGTVDGLIEGRLAVLPAGASVDLSLGPARGLGGERERTGYTEVVPLREYEESFEIRLSNDSADEVEIRVVEHLYRGEQFEIVKSDAEYTKTGAQTVEFRPSLKPGGKKSVHYTVRYRW